MPRQHYALYLDEPASPGFCSGSKLYIGSKAMLLLVAERMLERNPNNNTASAIKAYFSGDRKITHNIAYQEIPVLTRVKWICSSTIDLPAREWEHTNIWGFPYRMKFDKAHIEQALVSHKGKYYRCIRAYMKNLAYETSSGDWREKKEGFWGNASVLDVSQLPDGGFCFNNLLYVVEDVYDNLAEADEPMLEESMVKFNTICDEIFADG